MKKHLLMLLAWVAAFLIGVSAVVSAEPVLVVNTGDNAIKPYKWFDQDGNPVGPDIDIVTTLFQRVGVKITIEPVPFKRMLYNVKHGESFGAFVAYKIAEREAWATYIDTPIHWDVYTIFVKKGHEFPYETLEDLYGKRIGKGRGYNLGEELAQAAQEGKLTIEEVDTNEARILMLHRGRIDVMIASFHVTQYNLHELNLTEEIVTLPVPFMPPRATYLLISKAAVVPDKAELIEHLQQELRAMQEDGVLAEIASRYPGYSYDVLPREL